MAIKTTEELRSSLSAILGDDPSEDGLNLLEDLSDTMADLTGAGSNADYKAQYTALKKRYVERFNEPIEGGNREEPKDDKPRTFESLFKEE